MPRSPTCTRLRAALMQSYQQSGGYLPPKEVVQLSLAFTTVYHLGLDEVGSGWS